VLIVCCVSTKGIVGRLKTIRNRSKSQNFEVGAASQSGSRPPMSLVPTGGGRRPDQNPMEGVNAGRGVSFSLRPVNILAVMPQWPGEETCVRPAHGQQKHSDSAA